MSFSEITLAGPGFTGTHRVGSVLPLRRKPDGAAFVEIRDIRPSEVVLRGVRTISSSRRKERSLTNAT